LNNEENEMKLVHQTQNIHYSIFAGSVYNQYISTSIDESFKIVIDQKKVEGGLWQKRWDGPKKDEMKDEMVQKKMRWKMRWTKKRWIERWVCVKQDEMEDEFRPKKISSEISLTIKS